MDEQRRRPPAPPVTFQPPAIPTQPEPAGQETIPAPQTGGATAPSPPPSPPSRRPRKAAKKDTKTTAQKQTPAKKTTAAKKTTPAKTATPKAAAPAKAARAATAEPATRAAARTPAEAAPPTAATAGGVWSRIRANPGYAPELLALAAVDAIGPQARDWARDLRKAYPAADARGLTRLATVRFTRMARVAAIASAAAGVFAPAAELVALAWVHSALVLHVAAAHGHDPTEHARAADLLVLLGVHPSPDAARAAVAEAHGEGTRESTRLVGPLMTRIRGWGLRRLAGRLAPGAGGLLALAQATDGTERLAHRAARHYRATAN
jgi:hypothetical protein